MKTSAESCHEEESCHLRRRPTLLFWLLAALFALSGCGGRVTAPPASVTGLETDLPLTPISQLGPARLEGGERLQVAATTSIVGDVVATVGGDDILLTILLGPDTEPHSYTFTPSDLRTLSDVDLIFVNGLGLEVGFAESLQGLGPEAPVVSISEGIQARGLTAGAEGEGHPSGGGLDPHVWFDPTRVAQWAENAAAALASLDPENAGQYRRNAEAYTAELEELDGWIASEIAAIPEADRELVTDHDALGYFADRYGFRVVGAVIPAYSTLAEPSAREVAELLETIQAFEVRAVFVGVAVNPALAERVAQDAGIAVVPLYTGALSGPEGPAPTYLEFMRYNAGAVVAALTP